MHELRQIALELTQEMLRKSGVKEWADPETREQITLAAMEMAVALYGEQVDMTTRKILIPEFDGTPKQITFGDFAGDFSPTAANDLRHASVADTEVQLSLASLANSTSESTGARQSAKFDFGAVRAAMYAVRCALELGATPTAGAVIELWLAPSQHATAGTGNTGNASGSDAAYSGYSSNISASLKHCQYLGDFVCTGQATATVQVGGAGRFTPRERYGSLIVFNKSGAAFHSDDVESHIVFDPIFDQAQSEA